MKIRKKAAVHAKRFFVETNSGSYRFRFIPVQIKNQFRFILGSLGARAQLAPLGPGPRGLGPVGPKGPRPARFQPMQKSFKDSFKSLWSRQGL